MLIDLHVHEKTYSGDSSLSIEEIIHQGEIRGLDGVCITDHESQEIRYLLPRFEKETRLRLFAGAEVLTPHGDLLVYGLDKIPSTLEGTEAFIQAVNRQGGALVSAHPFRQNNRGFGHYLRQFAGIHVIEGYNGNTPDIHNQQAVSMAAALNKPLAGGSDAHRKERLGIFATSFPFTIHSEKQLTQALRKGLGVPVAFSPQGYQLLTHHAMEQEAVS